MLENLFNYSANMFSKNAIVRLDSITEVVNNTAINMLFRCRPSIYYENATFILEYYLENKLMITSDFINYYSLDNFNKSKSVEFNYRNVFLEFKGESMKLFSSGFYHELSYTNIPTSEIERELIEGKSYELSIICNTYIKEMYKIFMNSNNNCKVLVLKLKVE